MHSSFLRGSDFRITHRRQAVPHDRFFRDLSATDRVGVFAPGGIDGLGASLLLLAHTTAFYDRYRAIRRRLLRLSRLLHVPAPNPGRFLLHARRLARAQERAGRRRCRSRRSTRSWTGRSTCSWSRPEPPETPSSHRCRWPARGAPSGGATRTRRPGRPSIPTLAVACSRAEPAEWARAVIDSLPPDDSAVRGHWLRVVSGGSIPEQSFGEVPLERALALIG